MPFMQMFNLYFWMYAPLAGEILKYYFSWLLECSFLTDNLFGNWRINKKNSNYSTRDHRINRILSIFRIFRIKT